MNENNIHVKQRQNPQNKEQTRNWKIGAIDYKVLRFLLVFL